MTKPITDAEIAATTPEIARLALEELQKAKTRKDFNEEWELETVYRRLLKRAKE